MRKIILEDFGQDLTQIMIDEKGIIIDCRLSELYKRFLVGKWVINGYTNDNQSGEIKIGEPIYFIDNLDAESYDTLKSLSGDVFRIAAIENITV